MNIPLATAQKPVYGKPKKYIFKFLKISGWIAGSFILLLLILILLLRIPAIQNKITQKAISFLKEKIGTEVNLKSITISFPKKVVLQGLYLEDQAGDTLLYARIITLNTNLADLFQKKITLHSADFDSIHAHIKKLPGDSTYNFDYILRAFSSDSTNTSSDTTAKAWEFAIKNISLHSVHITYRDELHETRDYLGELNIHMGEFNLKDRIYDFDEIELFDSNLILNETSHAATPETTKSELQSSTFTLRFNDFHLKNVNATYSRNEPSQVLRARIGDLKIKAKEVDFNKKIIHLDQFELGNTLVSGMILSQKANKISDLRTPIQSDGTEFPWSIRINHLQFENNGVQYDDYNQPQQHGGLDLNHLWLFGLNMNAKDARIENKSIAFDLSNLSLKEKKGFVLQSFTAKVALNQNDVRLENFALETSLSQIKLDGQILNLPSDPLLRHWNELVFKIQLKPSQIAIKDILFLIPTSLDSLPIHIPEDGKIQLEATLSGNGNDLNFPVLNIKTLDSTHLVAHGTISGLARPKAAVLHIELDELYTTRTDARRIFPDSILETVVEFPNWVRLKGKIEGGLHAPAGEIAMTSSSGKLEIKGKINLEEIKRYDITIKTENLNVGQLMRQKDKMGLLDLSASIRGSGLKMKDMDARVNLLVEKFQYNRYEYKEFRLNGTVKRFLFAGDAGINDKNLNFSIQGDIDYNNSLRRYRLTLDLRNADLKELNLTARPLKFRGALDVDLTMENMLPLNGHLDIRKFAVYNGTDLYRIDSLLMVSLDKKGDSRISVRSDILTGDFNGTINLFSLPQVLRQHVSSYFHLKDTTIHQSPEDQNFTFELVLKNTDLLTEIIFPELEPFVPGVIRGDFNSKERKLDFRMALSRMQYASVGVDSLVMSLGSDKKSMDYRFALKNLKVDTLHIDEISLTGKIAHDSIYTALRILDSLAKEKYVIGGVIRSEKGFYRFHFLQKLMMLDYNSWKVPDDNFIQFGSKEFKAYHVDISREGEKISLVASDSITNLSFQNLELENITRIVTGVVPAGGKLNGDLKFTSGRKGEFNSKLQIQKLNILQKPWGDLTFGLTYAANTYYLDAIITGSHHQIQAKGLYVKKDPANEFNMTVNFSPLDLQMIEPLSLGSLKNMKGSLRGNIELHGNPGLSSIRGSLTFADASMTIKDLNSPFLLNNETITFTDAGIGFSNFTIHDNNGNTATLHGAIRTKTYRDFELAIRLVTKNFLLLDTHESSDALYYGKLRVNSDTQISGNLKSPQVKGKVSLGDDTNVTYVVPQSEKNVMEQKGIVSFVDRDAAKDPFLANIKPVPDDTSLFPKIDLTANLELSGKEILNIVIDPLTKDKLTVQGRAGLTLDMTEAGNMNLSGRYEITKGSYSFSFHKIVKRNFTIQRGSSINWTGDIYNAALNITAIYRTEAPPLELLSNQIASPTQTEINTYSQRLPFLVYLHIRGQLLAPDISFQLDMPDDKKGAFGGIVYAKLQDINTREAEVNKQVFALLILNRFMSDNPFDSQANNDLSNTARNSVSQLLSQQLNRLSKNVNGVELTLDVKSYEDYSTGSAQGKTQARLGVSKSLFNNRLVVKLSGNVDLEGQENTQNSATDYIGDIALEYRLTSDGRFRVTGFRQSDYEMIDGELVETGAGLIYIKDYNTLSELFRANEKKK